MSIVPCFWEVGPWCAGWVVEKLVFPLGVAYGVYRLALHQIEKTRKANLDQIDRKRQIDFADKQLSEFYAPMVGARAEILNHTLFDRRLRDAAHFVFERDWKRDSQGPEGAWAAHARFKERDGGSVKLKAFWAGINERLLGERIDAYLAMRELFGKKMAYADADTRAWYDYFYTFVEGWRVYRNIATNGFTSDEVVAVAMLDEENLQPFYRHLTARTNELQLEIQGKEVSKAPAPKPPELPEMGLLMNQLIDGGPQATS